MTRKDIESALRQAWRDLILAQPDFGSFSSMTSQRELNIAHHYANYILPIIVSQVGHISCDFDVWKSELRKRPDLIFHNRGDNSNNLLVVELKLDGNENQMTHELQRIQNDWFNDFGYQFGAYINVGRLNLELLDILVLEKTNSR